MANLAAPRPGFVWLPAGGLALLIHGGLAAALVMGTYDRIKPPVMTGGFELVNIAAFGEAGVEQKIVEPEKIPEPELEKQVAPEPEVMALPELPKAPPVAPIIKKKPPPPEKKTVKSTPKPVEVVEKTEPVKTENKNVETPKPVEPRQDKSVASLGQQSYVSPDATAAYLNNRKPPYPKVARMRNMQGRVLLAARVGRDGSVIAVDIKSSSGHGVLDRVARKTVLGWRFAPATRGGLPVVATVEVPINFYLNNKG